MDNVPFHHNKKLLKLIKKSGNMIMYTPKYNPNHNPIENFFSIFKNTYYNINKEKDIPLTLTKTHKYYTHNYDYKKYDVQQKKKKT